MLLTPHGLAGLVVAKYEPDFLPAALAVLTIHFVLDAIPHKDMIGGEHVNSGNIAMRAADSLILIGLFFWLVPVETRGYFAVIGLMALLPDIIEFPRFIWPQWQKLPIVQPFSHWHTEVLQYSWPKVGWVVGLLPQIILVGICIWVLL